ncbi:hypothetical protein K2173_009950 [Erythroxylum novogranatense]|uniref:Uncharacterized protein n=1 Tax=Erythroxylum novogranatense TaxID=1862640 RepID=A0AAV8T0P0_9ROSI|nr:hypothetical protein K2173_009950 [Erythroxylum novogranatense]
MKTVQGLQSNKPWLPKDRIDKILSDAEKLKTWLNEKEAEQSRTPGFNKHVFTSEEVFNLQDKVASFNKIPKPKPKVEKPKKVENERNAKTDTESMEG